MKQIELLLQNKGVSKSVIFPCSEAEYQATCEELELKDNYSFVRDVVEPKALALKKDTFVNLDEINYLAKRMDSFDQKELFSFFAAVEVGDYLSTKDLINLSFNLNYYTLIQDVSNLKSVGRNYVLCREVAISADELEKTDLYNYVKAANDKAFGFAKFINAYEWQGAIVSAGKTENENAAGYAMLSGLTLKNGETGALSEVSSDYDALIGCFKQGDKDGYMVTNFTDPNNKRTNTVTLTFSNCDKAAVYINGKLVVVDVSGGNVKFELLPGNAAFVVPL